MLAADPGLDSVDQQEFRALGLAYRAFVGSVTDHRMTADRADADRRQIQVRTGVDGLEGPVEQPMVHLLHLHRVAHGDLGAAVSLLNCQSLGFGA